MVFRGEPVDGKALRTIPLLTVEGEKDDISAPGQTAAAHEICSELPSDLREHFVQPGVGHYGVFSGRRWREQIAPRIGQFIRRFSTVK